MPEDRREENREHSMRRNWGDVRHGRTNAIALLVRPQGPGMAPG